MIVKQTPGFVLEVEVKPYRGWNSLELYQTFPQAQRPRRQRLVQLNLNDDELKAFRDALASQ